jgi:hypothetical protein
VASTKRVVQSYSGFSVKHKLNWYIRSLIEIACRNLRWWVYIGVFCNQKHVEKV